MRRKIMIHCDVPVNGVLTLPTVESIYEVPLILEEQGMGNLISDTLGLNARSSGWESLNGWVELVDRIKSPKGKLTLRS